MNKKQCTDTCQILSNVSTFRILIMNASCRHLGKMEDVNSASSADTFFQQLVIQSTMRALEIWHLQEQSFLAYHTSRKGLWLPTFLPESGAISIVIISNMRTKSTVRMRCVDDMVTHLPLRSTWYCKEWDVLWVLCTYWRCSIVTCRSRPKVIHLKDQRTRSGLLLLQKSNDILARLII